MSASSEDLKSNRDASFFNETSVNLDKSRLLKGKAKHLDSVYTSKIKVVANFLHFLDDPKLIEPFDIVTNLSHFATNRKFISQIIKKLLPQSPKKPSKQNSGPMGK